VAAPTLITPLEPGSPHAPPAVAAVPSVVGQQSVYATAFGRVEAAVASSCGTQHDTNEDAHSTLRGSMRMFVVADGVGGGAMAQTASRQLVSHLHEALDARRLDAGRVRAAMLDADRAIARRIAQVTESPGAATVALCAPVNVFASKWLVAWVGDCRVLRLAMRGEPGIELLTRDDTFRHLNETPPAGGSLDDPARMVGNGATSGANVSLHDLACGDMLVLCSDGMHKGVQAGDWCRILKQRVPLAQRCEELIALARINGATDDATVLLLQRVCFGEPPAGWIRGLVRSVRSKGPTQ
jgi:serine/threonine protein phosphatase PrpC